jgi:hypothetical protein
MLSRRSCKCLQQISKAELTHHDIPNPIGVHRAAGEWGHCSQCITTS